MAIEERDQEVGSGAVRAEPEKKRGIPGLGLIKGLGVTLKTMLHPAVTQQYPDVKPDLPPRTRGVIALKAENCTVCYKCSRECPDWCIYIDAHKETHEPATGGRARSVKVLDRFAIDYALCMYCGICVEVCPFDALFWAPDFEYAEFDILNMTHEKDRLEEWTYKVLPPPPLEVGAEAPPLPEETPLMVGGEPVAARPPSADVTSRPGAKPPASTEPAGGAPEGTTPPPVRPAAQAPAAPTVTAPGAEVDRLAGEAPTGAGPAAPAGAPPAQAPAPAAPAARPAAERHEVEPDQETFDRVLQQELDRGTDRRVAEGRARAAAIRAARKKAEG